MPPEAQQSQSAVSPYDEGVITPLVIEDHVGPSPTANARLFGKCGCQWLGIEPEVTVNVCAATGVPFCSRFRFHSWPHLQLGVGFADHPRFLVGIVVPKGGVGGRWAWRNFVKGSRGGGSSNVTIWYSPKSPNALGQFLDSQLRDCCRGAIAWIGTGHRRFVPRNSPTGARPQFPTACVACGSYRFPATSSPLCSEACHRMARPRPSHRLVTGIDDLAGYRTASTNPSGRWVRRGEVRTLPLGLFPLRLRAMTRHSAMPVSARRTCHHCPFAAMLKTVKSLVACCQHPPDSLARTTQRRRIGAETKASTPPGFSFLSANAAKADAMPALPW